MTNVIPLRPKTEEPAEQHGTGKAMCIGCKHEWQAVAPTGVTELECPSCGTMKGRWKFEYFPPDGTMLRECNCGNRYFYLTTEGHLCANCGTYQSY